MSNKKHPQRTCVVCREKRNKRDLTRLVMTTTGLCVDTTSKMNGRGAYLCEQSNCWEQAASQSILAKALRAELNDDDRMYLRQMKPS